MTSARKGLITMQADFARHGAGLPVDLNLKDFAGKNDGLSAGDFP